MPLLPASIPISAVVEGRLDEVVLEVVIRSTGATLGAVHGRQGKHFILKHLENYNRAAQNSPWIILLDLDYDGNCAPSYRRRCLPNPANRMCFRIAVREIEAWLLADRERLALFLGVPKRCVTEHPEAVPDPKHEIITLAARSRMRRLKQDMVPRENSGRDVGPAYNSRLIQFVMDEQNGWRPEIAAQSSESLRRAIACLRRLAAQ